MIERLTDADRGDRDDAGERHEWIVLGLTIMIKAEPHTFVVSGAERTLVYRTSPDSSPFELGSNGSRGAGIGFGFAALQTARQSSQRKYTKNSTRVATTVFEEAHVGQAGTVRRCRRRSRVRGADSGSSGSCAGIVETRE
jgi:hypothetical protein